MTCENDNCLWEFVPDWEGDPDIPNGTRDCSYWKCRDCGDEQFERPDGIDDDYPGPDFEPEEPDPAMDNEVDYIYDPLARDP